MDPRESNQEVQWNRTFSTLFVGGSWILRISWAVWCCQESCSSWFTNGWDSAGDCNTLHPQPASMMRQRNTFEIVRYCQWSWFLTNPKSYLFHAGSYLNCYKWPSYRLFVYLLTLVTFHSKPLKRFKWKRDPQGKLRYDFILKWSEAVQRTGMGSLPTHQQHLCVSAEGFGPWVLKLGLGK